MEEPSKPLMQDIEKAQTAFKAIFQLIEAALLQLGLILRFHRDVKALGVDNYAARSPKSLSDALKEAMNNYRDACDAIESTIMRARNAIMHEMVQKDPSLQAANSSIITQQPSQIVADQASKTIDTEQAAKADPSLIEDSSTDLLGHESMEDLFGPGTNSTLDNTSPTFTANPTSSTNDNASNSFQDTQAPLPDLSSFMHGDNSSLNPGMGIDLSQLGMGLDLSSAAFANSTSAIPDMSSFNLPNTEQQNSFNMDGMDFSQLTGDASGGGGTDFNALLAGLSGGTGAENMGLNLDGFDLSGILGDTSTQQQG